VSRLVRPLDFEMLVSAQVNKQLPQKLVPTAQVVFINEVVTIPSFDFQFLLLVLFFILFLSVVFVFFSSIHSPMTVTNSKGSKKPGTADSTLATPLAGLSRQSKFHHMRCVMSSCFCRTLRIRRRRAGSVDDTTDAIRAVACIRFVRPCCLVWAHRCKEVSSGVLIPVSSDLTETDAGDSDDDDVDCGQCPEGAHGAAAKQTQSGRAKDGHK